MNKEDNFVEVEIELDDDVLLKLAMLAHDLDITFNQLCNDILKSKIEKREE